MSEQLLWVIDRVLEDEFSLLDSADKLLKMRGYTRAHWQEVSAELETRLDALPKPAKPRFDDRGHEVQNRQLARSSKLAAS